MSRPFPPRRPPDRERRPDGVERIRTASDRGVGNLKSGSTLHVVDGAWAALARRTEQQRRTSLRQALTRVARDLEPFDAPAAALARHWAEVA